MVRVRVRVRVRDRVRDRVRVRVRARPKACIGPPGLAGAWGRVGHDLALWRGLLGTMRAAGYPKP